MIERVSTGIEGLDRALSGGIPKNTLTTISGPIGIGKTCMAWQFMRQGLYSDEKVLLLTAKDSPERSLQIASELGYDFGWALDQARLFIVDWRGFLPEGSFVVDLVQAFFTRILTLVNENDIKRLVFDPFMPMSAGGASTPLSFFRAIQDQLSERCPALTTLILMMEPLPETTMGSFPFDSWLSLGWKESLPRTRVMRIQKMPYTTVPPYDLTFDIISGEGIVILP